MQIRRRSVLAGMAAASLPRFTWASPSTDPDVVVVGAGAADLAATRTLLGNETHKKLVKGTFSRWDHNSWTRGSYAVPVPGGLKYREALRRPVADRIFFAGDSCHRGPYASVSHAHDSGVETAQRVLETMSGVS